MSKKEDYAILAAQIKEGMDVDTSSGLITEKTNLPKPLWVTTLPSDVTEEDVTRVQAASVRYIKGSIAAHQDLAATALLANEQLQQVKTNTTFGSRQVSVASTRSRTFNSGPVKDGGVPERVEIVGHTVVSVNNPTSMKAALKAAQQHIAAVLTKELA